MKSTINNKKQLVNIIKYALFIFSIGILIIAIMFFTNTGLFDRKTTDNNNQPQNVTNSNKTPLDNQPPNNKTSNDVLGASITYIKQENSALLIGTVIDKVSSEGSCTLTLTKDDQIETKTVDIQALASSSTCKGFDIPIVGLSPGIWNIKIDIIIKSTEVHLSDKVTLE